MNPLLTAVAGGTGVPAPPTPPPTLNSIRTTYINLFNQILDSSININCICKTTQRQQHNGSKQSHEERIIRTATRCPDDQDFMDDSDGNNEVDLESGNAQVDVEMNETDENHARQMELSSLIQKAEVFGVNQQKKICDLSCFENLKYIHNVLKNCFGASSSYESSLYQFEAKWNEFKFLSDNPKSCDYYGTTIYHYAASDNNFQLLRCIVRKYPEGVLCLDSKGKIFIQGRLELALTLIVKCKMRKQLFKNRFIFVKL
jgi:hypothetical protein